MTSVLTTSSGSPSPAARWDAIPGQDDAIALLRRAAARPSHAYLLVGPRGSGVVEAARCFAAELLADADDRVWDLALRGLHPDIVEIDPAANQIRIEDAQALITEVHRSPIEGARKVVLVLESERLNEQAANKLLKTLEEPPASAVIVLVTSGADQLLATIRSRCQRVDFAHLSRATVAAALTADGVAADRADLLAGIAGGRIDRARAFAGPLASVRTAFLDAALALDGTGGSVAVQVERVQTVLQDAVAGLDEEQATEREQLGAELVAAGYADRVVNAQLKRLADRHKRAHRRARMEVLLEGIIVWESYCRDGLVRDVAGADVLNADRELPALDPRRCADGLEACRAARQALDEFNPSEQLLLERLLLHLPAAR